MVVTTREDSHVTLYMKPRAKPALLQLTNLDSRFDGPLYVRLEREHEDPVEFIADPLYGRAQTFPVASGKSDSSCTRCTTRSPTSTSCRSRDAARHPGRLRRVVALYPR